jgi:hypothetical protein
MGCGLVATFFFAIFLVIAIFPFNVVDYNIPHQQCKQWQESKE